MQPLDYDLKFADFALIGTTASGKTDLAIKVATELGGVILSLDSLCVYKEIEIASAKPSVSDRAGIKHFGIDLIRPNEEFNAALFIKEYKKAKEYAEKLNAPLIIVGGTSFYLKSLLSGLSPAITPAKNYPENSEIYKLAKKIDPQFANKFSPNDGFRLKKWFDIFEFISGDGNIKIAPSQWQKSNTSEPAIKNLAIFELDFDKEVLKNRIKLRTKKMLENGLLDEAKTLFDRYPSTIKPLKSIGLKECGEFLQSGDADSKKLAELISTHTAQLAKKQRTFNAGAFKDRIRLNGQTPTPSLAAQIEQYITKH